MTARNPILESEDYQKIVKECQQLNETFGTCNEQVYSRIPPIESFNKIPINNIDFYYKIESIWEILWHMQLDGNISGSMLKERV